MAQSQLIEAALVHHGLAQPQRDILAEKDVLGLRAFPRPWSKDSRQKAASNVLPLCHSPTLKVHLLTRNSQDLGKFSP